MKSNRSSIFHLLIVAAASLSLNGCVAIQSVFDPPLPAIDEASCAKDFPTLQRAELILQRAEYLPLCVAANSAEECKTLEAFTVINLGKKTALRYLLDSPRLAKNREHESAHDERGCDHVGEVKIKVAMQLYRSLQRSKDYEGWLLNYSTGDFYRVTAKGLELKR